MLLSTLHCHPSIVLNKPRASNPINALTGLGAWFQPTSAKLSAPFNPSCQTQRTNPLSVTPLLVTSQQLAYSTQLWSIPNSMHRFSPGVPISNSRGRRPFHLASVPRSITCLNSNWLCFYGLGTPSQHFDARWLVDS